MIDRMLRWFLLSVPFLMFGTVWARAARAETIPGLDKATDNLIETGVLGTLLFLAIVAIVVLLIRGDRKDTAHSAALKDSQQQVVNQAISATSVMSDVRAALAQNAALVEKNTEMLDEVKGELSRTRESQERIVERLEQSGAHRAGGRRA